MEESSNKGVVNNQNTFAKEEVREVNENVPQTGQFFSCKKLIDVRNCDCYKRRGNDKDLQSTWSSIKSREDNIELKN